MTNNKMKSLLRSPLWNEKITVFFCPRMHLLQTHSIGPDADGREESMAVVRGDDDGRDDDSGNFSST